MFYMGEKVICVKRIFRSDVYGLTIDKEYEIIKEDKYSYLIVDDNNKTFPYDKNNFNLCISNFSRIVLEIAPEKIKESLINLSIKSDIEENYIRPTAWKIFLNVLPSSPDSTLKTWIETVKTQRAKFKTKVKELKTSE